MILTLPKLDLPSTAVYNLEVFDFNVAQYSPSLWLDGKDSSTITIDVGVSKWADKSGNGNDVEQLTTTKQPAYSSGSLVFDGGDYLAISDNASLSPSTEVTVFAVFENNDISSSGNILSKGYNESYRVRVNTSAKFSTIWNTDGGLLIKDSTVNVTQDAKYVSMVKYQAGVAITGELNGTNVINASNSDTTGIVDGSSQLFIGSGNASSEFWVGKISEIIVINRALTDDEISTITSYLTKKWV